MSSLTETKAPELEAEFSHLRQDDQSVYLDNAATTQKPQSVIRTISQFYQSQNANVHRGSYSSANEATNKYEATRKLVAEFINAPDPSHIVWTKGTTESINLVAYAWAEQHISRSDTIVVLGSEHHANFVPWQQLALKKSAHFEVVKVNSDGSPDLKHYEALLARKPKLVAVQHCSNALGNIHPILKLVTLAKNAGATTLVDGAQAVAHLDVDVQKIGCDFYVFSGHKMYGPTGIGVLYLSDRIKPQMSPFHYGGEMIQHVSIDKTSFRPIPYLLETGTPNISGVLGLKAAIEFMSNPEFESRQTREAEIHNYLVSKLQNISNVKLYGDMKNNVGIVSFTIEGESTADVGTLLDEQGISVRCGHHCAMPLMTALGISGTVRVSIAVYNTQSDIDIFISALEKTIKLLDI